MCGCNSLSGNSCTTSGSSAGLARTYIYGTDSRGPTSFTNSIINFNTVTVNSTYGGTYDSTTGVFTATRAGFFNFTYNINHPSGSSNGVLNIRKTGTPLTFQNLRLGHGVYVNTLTIPLSVNDTIDLYLSGTETLNLSSSIFCFYDL
jgi:hypothetical protein